MNKRVLWLSPGFAADEEDHNCIPTLQLLARGLQAQGVDMEIVTLTYPFQTQPYHWHDIPVYPAHRYQQHWLRWVHWYKVLQLAEAAHRRQPFEVIHSFWLGPTWVLGQYLQSKWRVPHYTTLMGQDVLPTNKYLYFLRAKHLSTLVALSNGHQEALEKTTGKCAAYVIPTGVAIDEIPKVMPTSRPLDILGCGSLIPLKNWELWLQVVRIVAQQRPNLKGELIGDGVNRIALERMIAREGLQHTVLLRGSIPRPQVLARMQEAKVLLHTSRFESLGFVLSESAMNGCRVVSTPVGIAPQIADGLGQDPYMLSIEVLKALDKPILEAPNTPFTMSKTVEAYLNLYG